MSGWTIRIENENDKVPEIQSALKSVKPVEIEVMTNTSDKPNPLHDGLRLFNDATVASYK